MWFVAWNICKVFSGFHCEIEASNLILQKMITDYESWHDGLQPEAKRTMDIRPIV
jgi:hypothetical protein